MYRIAKIKQIMINIFWMKKYLLCLWIAISRSEELFVDEKCKNASADSLNLTPAMINGIPMITPMQERHSIIPQMMLKIPTSFISLAIPGIVLRISFIEPDDIDGGGGGDEGGGGKFPPVLSCLWSENALMFFYLKVKKKILDFKS